MLAVREGLLIRGGEGIMAKMDRQVTPSFFVSKIYAIYANIEGGEGDQTNFAITIVTVIKKLLRLMNLKTRI